jgi:hypothetical protein
VEFQNYLGEFEGMTDVAENPVVLDALEMYFGIPRGHDAGGVGS